MKEQLETIRTIENILKFKKVYGPPNHHPMPKAVIFTRIQSAVKRRLRRYE